MQGATFFCPHPYDVKLLATFDVSVYEYDVDNGGSPHDCND